jgi:Leucine-rich repeat (LRR) protein
MSDLPDTMPSLQYLNCSSTQVNNINIAGYKMLTILYCQGCPIDVFSFDGNGITIIN